MLDKLELESASVILGNSTESCTADLMIFRGNSEALLMRGFIIHEPDGDGSPWLELPPGVTASGSLLRKMEFVLLHGLWSCLEGTKSDLCFIPNCCGSDFDYTTVGQRVVSIRRKQLAGH